MCIRDSRKFEPNTLNINTKIFTPNIVNKLTVFPNKNINVEILIACVTELLKEKIIPSNGCVLNTVIGVRTVAEWWTLCSDQRIGQRCINLWMKYLLKSSMVNWKVVKEITTIIGKVFANIPTLSQSIEWK